MFQGEYLVVIICALIIIAAQFYVAASVKRGPTYWPVLRLQTATNSFRTTHLILLAFLHTVYAAVVIDLTQWLINFALGAIVAVWTAYLVHKRNNLLPGFNLDDYGRIVVESAGEAAYHLESLRTLAENGVLMSQPIPNFFTPVMIDPAHDGVIGVTREGKIFSFNEGAETMLGWRANSMVGKPALLLVPERYHQNIQRFLDAGEGRLLSQTFEVPVRVRSGGETRAYMLVTKIIKDNQESYLVILRPTHPDSGELSQVERLP